MTVRAGAGPAPRALAAAAVTAAGAIVMAWAAIAQATHPGPPRLYLDALEVRPGGTLVIRGTDMGADQPVTLVLTTMPGAERTLGTAVADGLGHFTRPVQVPRDAAQGVYAISAVVGGRPATRALLAVQGPPLPPADDGNQQTSGAEPLRGPASRSSTR